MHQLWRRFNAARAAGRPQEAAKLQQLALQVPLGSAYYMLPLEEMRQAQAAACVQNGLVGFHDACSCRSCCDRLVAKQLVFL